MSIILSHSTALELLRARPPQAYPLIRTSDAVSLADGGTDYRELRRADLSSLGVTAPLTHVLVSTKKDDCKAAHVRTHHCNLEEIPAGLLLWLAPGVYMAAPELVFIQMARRVSLCAATVLGCELCGGYSQYATMISGFYDRPPLTSKASIAMAAHALEGLYGLGKAYEPLACVLDGSRSPMETVLACELSMPPARGGQGFEQPVLNHEQPLDAPARAKAGTSSSKPDLAWPRVRLGVEYDSDECHGNPKKDRARREALSHMGWTIYTVDLDQMHSWSELMKTVALLEGGAPRKEAPPTREASRSLHEKLLKATRCGVGLEAALFPAPVARGLVRCHV